MQLKIKIFKFIKMFKKSIMLVVLLVSITINAQDTIKESTIKFDTININRVKLDGVATVVGR